MALTNPRDFDKRVAEWTKYGVPKAVAEEFMRNQDIINDYNVGQYSTNPVGEKGGGSDGQSPSPLSSDERDLLATYGFLDDTWSKGDGGIWERNMGTEDKPGTLPYTSAYNTSQFQAATDANAKIASQYANYFPQDNDVLKYVGIIAAMAAPFALGLGSPGGLAEAAGIGGGGGGGTILSAADTLGLQQMGGAAGLSGSALDSFVASGGTLGSTAAGGGGLTSLLQNPPISGALGGGSGGLTEAQAIELAGTEMTPAELAQMPGGVPEVQFSGPPPTFGSSSLIPGIPDNLLGLGLQGALSLAGSSATGDTIEGLYNTARGDRLPALNAFNSLLTPSGVNNFWQSPEIMGAVDAGARALSTVNGNPAANPGDLAKLAANNYGLLDTRLRTLSGPAFGTANTEFNLGTNMANNDASLYNSFGSILNQYVNPPQTLSQLLTGLRGLNSTGPA